MEIDFLENTFMLYIVASMLVTWVCLMNSQEYRQASRINRFKETLFCCALTGAIAVPLVDYFTTVPSSIALIIGALVGILGYKGIIDILRKVGEIALNIVPNVLSGVFNVPTHRTVISKRPELNEDDGDEPPPIRKRNERK